MRSGTFGAPKGEEKNPSTYTKNVTQPSLDKGKTAASWQWMRNSKTPPKSELRRGKKWSFAGVRSGTFGAPKGEEKRSSTLDRGAKWHLWSP